MRRAVVLVALLVSCGSCLGPPQPRMGPTAAEAILSSAKIRARREGKQVFLLFVAPACEWCDCFDRYHGDPEVSRIIDKHFVLAKVDVKATGGGEQMYLEHGNVRGAPAFTLLDDHGAFLAGSGDASDNIGFPANEEEIDRYFECLKIACPTLTVDDMVVLRKKLEETRPASSGGHPEQHGEAESLLK
jgi:Thioredoxin-like